MRVLVVSEYYPRVADPALGVWAHRQAVASAQAGAEVRVLVLHRPIPPLSALRSGDARRALAVLRQPGRAELDGLEVRYLRYLSPPRSLSYQSWGAWAAPWLRRALAAIRRSFPYELIHAHYAVPVGDAIRRADPEAPLVISVHGHDVQGRDAGGPLVAGALRHAGLVLANSHGTAERSRRLGAAETQVVHLGTDLPAGSGPGPGPGPGSGRRLAPTTPAAPATPATPAAPALVTVAHLVARKHHEDVIAAVATLRERHPALRYVVVGDGPERARLEALAASLGVGERVEFRGALAPAAAVAAARAAALFVLPSTEEAFGVAYIEAMAGGVPAIGCRGEDGPEEIAAAGGGIVLVPPRDPAALAAEIDRCLSRPEALAALGREARETVARSFTWERCGEETVRAYARVLARG